MKKTILVIILGIVTGIALAACDNHYSPRYISEETYRELQQGGNVTISVNDDTMVYIYGVEGGSGWFGAKESVKKDGTYKEEEMMLIKDRGQIYLEDQIDRLLLNN